MLKVIHFSDWHNNWIDLPYADMYICTGDMLDNYPSFAEQDSSSGNFGFYGAGYQRQIDPEEEAKNQLAWFKRKFLSRKKSLRSFLKNKDAPVVVVRGNHDFIDLGQLFGGDVFEVTEPTDTAVVCGFKIGGFRGINYIVGEWSDEIYEQDLDSIVDKVPKDLDILVSHAPPQGILDECYGTRYGVRALSRYINQIQYKVEEKSTDVKMPKLFCFGHVHSNHGTFKSSSGTFFSNAATTYNEIELDI